MTDGGFDNQALIDRAVGGDAVALKLLLVEVFPHLCAVVERRIPADLRRTVDAEDVVQEAEVEIFRHIESFRPQGDNAFMRWCATLALNQLRDLIRRRRAAKRGGDIHIVSECRRFADSTIALFDRLAGPGHTPSQSIARGEAVAAVESALSQLPPHYREAVGLVHIQGRPVAEAAAAMGRTERAVHGLCRRGLKQLQQHLRSDSRFLSTG